jgi:YbbR domain-containing protein
MSWPVGSWRLKILAVVLSVALLAAVAFSENPPVAKHVSIGVSYQNIPNGLVLVDPPSSVSVNVSGLSDAVRQFGETQVGAVVDLGNARAGNGQTYYAVVAPPTVTVNVESSRIPVRLNVEQVASKQLDVQVRVTNVDSQQGITVVPEGTYATCGDDSLPCKITVVGPKDLLNGLSAYVKYDVKVTGVGVERAPSLPVEFERNGQPFALKSVRTLPDIVSISQPVVTARIETQGGQLTKTVAVSVQATGQPACGYRLDGVTISPDAFVTISGPNAAMEQINAIALAPVDIAGATASESFDRTLTPSVRGVRVVSPTSGSVRVTVLVSQAFSCAAPTPNANPSPAPTPARQATPTPGG